MSVVPIMLPKDLKGFISGAAEQDLLRAEQLINALQNLKVQVNINGSTQTVNATIQISGEAAVIVLTL